MARYYLSMDNDSHWYVVPVEMQSKWDAWCDIPPDDERAWLAPAYAVPLGGSPSSVMFTDPVFSA